MKKALVIVFCSCILNTCYSQSISYGFSALAGTYTPLVSPTAIPEIYWGADNELSGAYAIGFSFQFGCTAYTQYKVSADGWLTFNLGGSVSFMDAINDLSGYAGMRPGIAPLWDDLAWNNNFPPQCGYQLSGVSPNQVLTIQWTKANWKISGTAPGELSFQVKLYETSNRIEMIYHQETGTLNAPSASIGLAGTAIGDYYSVNAAFTAATKVTNVQNIATKPAEGQIFRWDPLCSTLPIDLISFAGEPDETKNVLSWSTATENNSAYFSLERSEDGSSFAEIAVIKAAGNSDDQKNYEFTDKQTDRKLTYYRLKQVDADRTFSYSKTIALNDNVKNKDIRVFPVPASGLLTVSGTSAKNYVLTDVSGKTIKEGLLLNGGIDVSDVNNGFYVLRLDDNAVIHKVLVQH